MYKNFILDSVLIIPAARHFVEPFFSARLRKVRHNHTFLCSNDLHDLLPEEHIAVIDDLVFMVVAE